MIVEASDLFVPPPYFCDLVDEGQYPSNILIPFNVCALAVFRSTYRQRASGQYVFLKGSSVLSDRYWSLRNRFFLLLKRRKRTTKSLNPTCGQSHTIKPVYPQGGSACDETRQASGSVFALRNQDQAGSTDEKSNQL